MKGKESYLWTSYSDLMTSLFFVMLVLFVLSLAIVKKNNIKIIRQNQELTAFKDSLSIANQELISLKDSLSTALVKAKTTIEQQNRILRIDEQFRPLLKSGVFKYYPKTKKFVAKDFLGVEIFSSHSSKILPQYYKPTVRIGVVIDSTLQILHKENPDFSYLLVIEGNVANSYDNRYSKDGINGYKLSYERALSVYNLWVNHGIDLRKYNTEVMICGSGWNGLDRDNIEEYNKRFSIQIIPKISSPQEVRQIKNIHHIFGRVIRI